MADKLHMNDLTGECCFWHNFVNSNILPSTNLSDVNLERATLLYTITGLGRLNIATVLSNRICHMVRGSRKKELLGFASLINHLCTRAGVYIPDDEALDVHPAPTLTLTQYTDCCQKAESALRKRVTTVDLPPSPRVARVSVPPPGPAPVPPPPAYAAEAAPAYPQAPPPQGALDFYGLQQQLSHLSAQNSYLIMQGDYHSRFLEHAYPEVPYSTFQPTYPDIPPPYMFQQPYQPPPPPPADTVTSSCPFYYPDACRPRRVVMEDDAEDSDD